MDSYVQRVGKRVLWGATVVDWTLKVVGRDGAHMVECLSNMQETPVPGTAQHEPDTAVLVCNLSMREVDSGRSEVNDHPLLHMGFEASGGYMGSCL